MTPCFLSSSEQRSASASRQTGEVLIAWPMSRSTSASSFSRKNADEDGGRFVHTLPCECGLRPKRLSGFGTARMGAAPSSVPGLQAQGGRGLTPTFSLAGFPAGNSDIQGGPSRDTASSREREGLLGAENLVDGHSNTFPDWKKTCIPAKGRERQAREQVRNAAA